MRKFKNRPKFTSSREFKQKFKPTINQIVKYNQENFQLSSWKRNHPFVSSNLLNILRALFFSPFNFISTESVSYFAALISQNPDEWKKKKKIEREKEKT